MNTPFLFALPGVETEELESWQENGEAWRRLKVTFPERIATHSAEQTFYFDRQGLLKRHDYEVDVRRRSSAAAHYVSALTDVSGIVVPTKHTILPRQPDGKLGAGAGRRVDRRQRHRIQLGVENRGRSGVLEWKVGHTATGALVLFALTGLIWRARRRSPTGCDLIGPQAASNLRNADGPRPLSERRFQCTKSCFHQAGADLDTQASRASRRNENGAVQDELTAARSSTEHFRAGRGPDTLMERSRPLTARFRTTSARPSKR